MSHAAQPQIGAVVALWRYPVKSMQGEELQTAQVRDQRSTTIRARWECMRRSCGVGRFAAGIGCGLTANGCDPWAAGGSQQRHARAVASPRGIDRI
jgi:MOSC N-terminal beta barrel domain